MEPRRYIVRCYVWRKGPGSACDTKDEVVLAYDAKDARIQVELRYEGEVPTRLCRVVEIAPAYKYTE